MTLLIPQRGLLFGLPLALIVWVLLWTACDTNDPARRARRLTAAGVIAGLLPLIHLHSFAVLLAVAVCLVPLFPDRHAWPRFFVAAVLVALPQVLWLFSGTSLSAGSFVGPAPGWDRDGGNPLWFWIHNTGLVLPGLVFVLLWRGQAIVPGKLLRFLAPWAGCFIVPNLLRLSPWIWDNIKFLFYAYVAATPLLALLVVWLWRRHRLWGRAGAVLLFVSLTLAGALDVTRVVSRAAAQRIFDRPALHCASLIRRETPPRALILHAPTYNHPVLLAGRRSMLGYTGHIFSQGLAAGSREREIREVYRGGSQAVAWLRAWGVTYVVVGPLEEGLGVSPFFLAALTPVGETDGYRLYSVPGR